MKKLKILITIIIIFILILVSVIIIFNKKERNPNEIIENTESMGIGEFSDDITKQTNITEILRVDACIDKFLNVLNIKGSLYYGINDEGEYAQLVEDSYIREKAMDFLSKSYIEKNNITEDNIDSYLGFLETRQEYTIINIEKVKDTNPNQFITYGFISENNEFKYYMYYVLTLDTVNATFSIEPIKEKVEDINEITVEEVEVEANTNNKIPVTSVDAESICKFYFNTLKNILVLDPGDAYNLLDEEYAKKRFGNMQTFANYIEANKPEIMKYELSKYKINSIDNEKNEYLLIDQYQNVYVINAKTVTNYTVKLDTYTITSDTFEETYGSSNNQKKVMMNVDKWVQMLNNRDYTSAYNLLDETYRNNTFGSEEQFEATMREKLPLHYKVEYSNFSEEKETYMQDITLTDITGEEEGSVQISVIMQLKEDLDFVMSFSFQE